ncbi:MAG: FHA domain-containing protein [Kofleriaceae bacterium]
MKAIRRSWWMVALVAGAAMAQPAPAPPGGGGGGGIELLTPQVKMPNLNDPKTEDDPPSIDVTVIGAPKTTADKFVLVDKTSKPPIEIKASKIVDFKKGTETIAVAIVLQGWEWWIGNDKEVPPTNFPQGAEDPSHRAGVLVELRAALDALKFGEAGPPGSLGTVITYGDKAVTRVPMGPLGNITGSALGTQMDYFGASGSELVQGVNMGISELHKVTAGRKVLIVVCDGTDTNNETAKIALLNSKRQAKDEGIQTFAIVYRIPETPAGNVIGVMIPQTTQVNGAQNIASTIASILSRMDDRQYVTFNGYNRATQTGFLWDNKVHKLVVQVNGKDNESEEVEVTFPLWDPTPPSGFPWLVVIIVVVGVLLLIVIMVKVFSKKEAPAPAPMPMPMAPMPMPEAPKPLGPMKTVMIGQGGEEGGFPVVGWLVPLNGQNAYQTLRLRSSGTKIGTAPPADIVINDGFMSTEHCQIHCSPQGFTLIDGGSTNGSYVNDRKIVGKHELVDNDMVTFGKTNFKFKSIV